MSWREVLGASAVAEYAPTHNPHITRNMPSNASSAVNADSAEHQALRELLANVVDGEQITPDDVHGVLTPEELSQCYCSAISAAELSAIAESIVQRKAMYLGKIPAHYTEVAFCKGCGPVWLWFSGEVVGCPWCWNRAAGYPVPLHILAHSDH